MKTFSFLSKITPLFNHFIPESKLDTREVKYVQGCVLHLTSLSITGDFDVVDDEEEVEEKEEDEDGGGGADDDDNDNNDDGEEKGQWGKEHSRQTKRFTSRCLKIHNNKQQDQQSQ